MKVRTSLAAVAAATAVTVSGVAVADAAPTVNETAESRANATEKAASDNGSSSGEEGSSIQDMDPNELKSWIAVVTAIVGMLTQILTVASRFAR